MDWQDLHSCSSSCWSILRYICQESQFFSNFRNCEHNPCVESRFLHVNASGQFNSVQKSTSALACETSLGVQKSLLLQQKANGTLMFLNILLPDFELKTTQSNLVARTTPLSTALPLLSAKGRFAGIIFTPLLQTLFPLQYKSPLSSQQSQSAALVLGLPLLVAMVQYLSNLVARQQYEAKCPKSLQYIFFPLSILFLIISITSTINSDQGATL